MQQSETKLIGQLRAAIGSVYLGNPGAIDQLLVCLLARGHCLIEDVPGVGKTVLATALARAIDCSFSRLQLTPDLLPSDILGVSIFQRDRATVTGNGQGTVGNFVFQRGPVFANIVLADEINRATPRTQTALLEAMNEASVTVDGITHKLDMPFMLVATQNPTDFEGTFVLPENQLDRFLMRIALGYPTREQEAQVLLTRPASAHGALATLQPALHASDVLALQVRTDEVRIDRSLVDYIIALATATREDARGLGIDAPASNGSADRYSNTPRLMLGLSPRGSLALLQAAKATAMIRDRQYVIPEDITSNILPVCAHRVLTRAGLGAANHHELAGAALARIVRAVGVPA